MATRSARNSLLTACAASAVAIALEQAALAQFAIEEATIEGMHAAIRSGATTCAGVVSAYIERARAYNGVASRLITRDGLPIAPASGAVRAGAPLVFPTSTTSASTLLPDLDRYRGRPLEFGRMEPTASDPAVQQQYGMIAGVPNGGQLNALATLNIRGERSVTCRGEFDRHPSQGPLPAGAPTGRRTPGTPAARASPPPALWGPAAPPDVLRIRRAAR